MWIGDKKLSLAQAAMEAGDVRTAAATLAGAVAEDLGAVGGDLLKRVQRAAALEVLLAAGVKSAKTDSVVTNNEARELLALCDEYLLLNPQGLKVQKLADQCRSKLVSVISAIGMELIEIPAGEFFTMGSSKSEEFRHDRESQVSVRMSKPFGLGKTEVTQGQWKEVMGTEPWKGQKDLQADKDCPATYVSWDDATEFCEKLTELERKSGKLKADEEYRLPTEAEWEYACRAGTIKAYSFGDNEFKFKLREHLRRAGEMKTSAAESKLGEYAWFSGNADLVGEQYAHKVGMKKPNPCGLHDMHGNVREWCSDWYGEALSGGVDPAGPNGGSFRVGRGGSWGDDPGSCRSADRDYYVPSFRSNGLGFRVARSQSKMEKPEPVKKVKSGAIVTNSIGMALIEIPAGIFKMGSPAGEKDRIGAYEAQVTVTLTKTFGLGKTEVTQWQWKSVMGTHPWNGQGYVRHDKDYPATYVNWDDATEFCEKLTELERKSGKLKADEEYRLPTEAEWEYSCRAGKKTAFSFGDDESKLGEYAWFSGNADLVGEQYAHEVGLKKPNPWGLHDMHGNVREWCSDWFSDALSGGTDPVGPDGGSGRVNRGGWWGHSPDSCRSASRCNFVPSDRDSLLGFRVARSQSVQ